jgi:hypothetical protein
MQCSHSCCSETCTWCGCGDGTCIGCAETAGLHDAHPLALGNGTGGAVPPTQPQRHRVAWLWVAADQQWYSADVVAQDAGTQTHRLVYHVNGKVRSCRCVHNSILRAVSAAAQHPLPQDHARSLHSTGIVHTVLRQGEWLDLAAAEREGRLHWGDNAAAAAQSGAQDVKAAEQLRQGQTGAAVQHTSSTTVPSLATAHSLSPPCIAAPFTHWHGFLQTRAVARCRLIPKAGGSAYGGPMTTSFIMVPSAHRTAARQGIRQSTSSNTTTVGPSSCCICCQCATAHIWHVMLIHMPS